MNVKTGEWFVGHTLHWGKIRIFEKLENGHRSIARVQIDDEWGLTESVAYDNAYEICASHNEKMKK